MEQFIKDSSLTIRDMDKEHSSFIMAISIKENSDMINITEWEITNMLVVVGIWEIGSTIIKKAMADTITTIKIFIKDNLRTVKQKDMG